MPNQITTGELIEKYSVSMPQAQKECKDTYYTSMIGCKGKSYAKKKLDLLRQLGHSNLPENIFDGLTETEIDRKARSIIFAS